MIILRLTICPQVDIKGADTCGERKRETGQQAGEDTVPGRTHRRKTHRRPLAFPRRISEQLPRELLRDRVTALLRYCVTVLLPLYCVTAVGIAVRRVTAFTALG